MTARLVLLLLVGVMLGLPPAALASPPDQHCQGGLYADADYDDVVLAAAETVASLPLEPSPHLHRLRAVVSCVLPADGESGRASATLSSTPPRAPPTS